MVRESNMKAGISGEWRDGFLFVGNQLALDFLNTRLVMDGEQVELLADGGALARWMGAAGLIDGARSTRLQRRWPAPEFAAGLDEVRQFRESLRRAVFQVEAGDSPSGGFVRELNRLLVEHPYVDQIVGGES